MSDVAPPEEGQRPPLLPLGLLLLVLTLCLLAHLAARLLAAG
jgi:hypothetical protein